MSNKYDFIVVGGGIVGLASAYKLQLKFPNKSIAVLEKETEVGMHQTGNPSTMHEVQNRSDIMKTMIDYFNEKKKQFAAIGLTQWIIDPGFGFFTELNLNKYFSFGAMVADNNPANEVFDPVSFFTKDAAIRANGTISHTYNGVKYFFHVYNLKYKYNYFVYKLSKSVCILVNFTS